MDVILRTNDPNCSLIFRMLGELYEYGLETQHLRFEFTTDQTCLGRS